MIEIEVLERRDLPSATLLAGTLFILEQGAGTHTVSVDRAGTQIQVTEGDGVQGHEAVSLFDAASVTSVFVKGADASVNIIQNNTSITGTLLGGDRGDTIFGGSGINVIDPGKGDDLVYSLLGVNTVSVREAGRDQVFTNFGAAVSASLNDGVVRFFGPGRTPGTPFIGLDASLNDGVLYITPSNNNSSVVLTPGREIGSVVAVYDLDLSDSIGAQTQTFSKIKYVAYFGGGGDDTLINGTAISDLAYGSAGNDTLVGGRGPLSVLKGLGGNDTLIGSATHTDLSGNAGTDTLIRVNGLDANPGDVFRVDALDMVFGALAGDVFLSP